MLTIIVSRSFSSESFEESRIREILNGSFNESSKR
jgi:hypothetical protein